MSLWHFGKVGIIFVLRVLQEKSGFMPLVYGGSSALLPKLYRVAISHFQQARSGLLQKKRSVSYSIAHLIYLQKKREQDRIIKIANTVGAELMILITLKLFLENNKIFITKIGDYIMKFLIVDDEAENISAIQIAIALLGSHDVIYATGAKEAIGIIEHTYKKDTIFFDIVITDLEMEERESGLNVFAKSAEYLAFPFIVTGRTKGGQNHGPSVRIEPIGEVISGKKSEPHVWQHILQKIESFFATPPNDATWESLKNYRDFVAKPSKDIAELFLTVLHNTELFLEIKTKEEV